MTPIRRFRPKDTAVLAAIHNQIHPDVPHTAASFKQYVAGKWVWVIEDEGEVGGFTAVSPVPGLNGVFNLEGAIAPQRQRQGLGSRLLAHVQREAPGLGARQLSHSVTDIDSPATHFLRHYSFFMEHEEWVMVMSDFSRLPTAVPPLNCRIKTQRAFIHVMRQFRMLYAQSFDGVPWYQPYSIAEIEETLGKPTDILFLLKGNEPIGFAWLNENTIEPIGIVKGEQGKGYGRFLLLSTLHTLQQRGATQAQIGLWR